HSSDAITKEFYIEKNQSTPDVTHLLQSFADNARTTTSQH
ncbi:MAG: site-specific tyrosine recombinase XerC, partial [Nocardioides sp.]|nr:site-specific tyrosine recombinase XerC [Nocardioides sp.]